MNSPSEDGLVEARALNEFAYCPRLYHLMYVQGVFDDSADTEEGRAQHKRRRAVRKGKTKAEEDGDGEEDESDDVTPPWDEGALRDLTLSDPEWGLVGRMDGLVLDGGAVIPVEDKHGPAPDRQMPFAMGPFELPGDVWYNDRLQLVAQMRLLRANGYTCDRGRIYYRKTRTLVELPYAPAEEEPVRWAVGQIRELRSLPMPTPLLDSPKCIRCSLSGICLPDETHALTSGLSEPRRLVIGRDDAGVLYATDPGTSVAKSGGNFLVRVPGQPEVAVPQKDVAHVCLFGASQITTQALLSLTRQGGSVSYVSLGGWLEAVTSSPLSKNPQLRRDQTLAFADPDVCLRLARGVVRAKILNQRTLLRRNRNASNKADLLELKRLARRTEDAADLAALRGMEGLAARIYWKLFPGLLSGTYGALSMDGRNRRPPKDPVNALLSYGYALLVRDFVCALHAAGLDPYQGFYHALEAGRPALALDLMEAFRPLVVDSCVLRSLNEGVLQPSDFLSAPGYCVMKKAAKKSWIAAYERRADEMVTHPRFEYRLSYRRIFHLESRLLGRFLQRELPDYLPLMTR